MILKEFIPDFNLTLMAYVVIKADGATSTLTSNYTIKVEISPCVVQDYTVEILSDIMKYVVGNGKQTFILPNYIQVPSCGYTIKEV